MENSFRVCMLFLLISNLLLSHGALGKNLTVTVNPGCSASTADCSLPWLVDVISQPSDSLNATQYHHVWGAMGAPTLMAIESPADTKLSVDWSLLASHQASAIQLQPAPLSVFGVAITEIILFDDVNDEGSIRNVNSSAQISLPSSLFDWNFTVSYTDSDVHVSFYTTHCNNTELEPNSGLYINVSASLEGRRSDDPPRLFCHASAAAVDFILDNLILNVTNPNPSDYPPRTHDNAPVPPISGFNSPRYAARFVYFSSEARQGHDVVHESLRSLDDEYAPGIFTLDAVTTDGARDASSSPAGGYMQWRPVAYRTADRDVNDATLPSLSRPQSGSGNSSSSEASASPKLIYSSMFEQLLADTSSSDLSPLTEISSPLRESLAYALMGDGLNSTRLAAETLVSFGAPEDGYYTSTSYTVWSFTAGSGSPPTEGLSTNVLIVIVVGLGVPVLAMLLAGIGLAVWKCRKGRTADHEALLSQEEDGAQAPDVQRQI